MATLGVIPSTSDGNSTKQEKTATEGNSNLTEAGKLTGNTGREGLNLDVGDLLTSLADIHAGMKVEAKDAYGKWYIARVMEVDEEEDEVLVHFERWNSRYDEYVKPSSGRLRILPPERMEALEKERELKFRKSLSVGDLVQAKWEDGRMYFGKVLKVYKEEVDVLFDDGVKFKAPISSVRKRSHQSRSNLSRSSLNESDSSLTPNSRALRAQKRHRSEDSTSQTSFSSPPSSPVFVPSKKRRVAVIDSDSTYSDSEFDESLSSSFQTRSLENPLPEGGSKRGRGRKGTKRSLSASSDSDTPGVHGPTRKRKRSFEDTRDPYRLRHASPQLSPVKELSVNNSNHKQSDQQSTLLTPPTDLPNPSNPSPQTVTTIVDSHLSPSFDPTPPETPGVKSKSGVTEKRVTSGMRASRPVGEGTPKKDLVVASRTRAQRKVENVTKKADPKKSIKVAPKEMVIVWDHNEFKCKHAGCNKSFRKETLLQSHIKHYHNEGGRTTRQTPRHKDKTSKKESSISPKTSPPEKSIRSSLSPLSESVLSPLGATPKGTKIHKQSLADDIKGTKVSPKSTKKQNKDLAKKIEVPKQDNNSVLVVDGQDTSTSVSQSQDSSLTSHSSNELQTAKTAKKYLNSNHSSLLSVAGPPQKVPIIELKALPRESLSPKKRTKTKNSSTAEASESCEELFFGEAKISSHPNIRSGVMSVNGEDDVVHCVCGDLTDEGFMIQCEQCLCWQHGDCISVSKNSLPDKYVCGYCTNPPGLRNRLKYQFDREWYNQGILPSLPCAPKFPHSSSIKVSHQLTDTLYKLKKMLHSSKVKLQAASRISHPYMRQWSKECTHLGKNDIISYLIAALVPISYYSQHKEVLSLHVQTDSQTINGESQRHREVPGESESGNGLHEEDLPAIVPNGSVDCNHSSEEEKTPINVASLRLDPLPITTSPVTLSSNGKPSLEECNDTSPDLKTLKLAPLPPLKTESIQQLTTEILKKTIELSVSKLTVTAKNKTTTNSSSTDTSTVLAEDQPGPKIKTEPHDVINDEFGVQELSIFALDAGKNKVKNESCNQTPTSSLFVQSPIVSSSPTKLISSSRSAFRPVTTPSLQTSTGNNPVKTLFPSTTAGDPSQTIHSFCSKSTNDSSVGSTPKLSSTSTMDSVSLGEFADAFMQGDTTNWFQRMQLLDHIEKVQEKVSVWMDSLEEQLDELPLGDESDDIEELLKEVQSTMTQLRHVQQSIS